MEFEENVFCVIDEYSVRTHDNKFESVIVSEHPTPEAAFEAASEYVKGSDQHSALITRGRGQAFDDELGSVEWDVDTGSLRMERY